VSIPLLTEGQGEALEHSSKAGQRWKFFFAIFKELHNKPDNLHDDKRNKAVRGL
jgi:hypothetical protein